MLKSYTVKEIKHKHALVEYFPTDATLKSIVKGVGFYKLENDVETLMTEAEFKTAIENSSPVDRWNIAKDKRDNPVTKFNSLLNTETVI